MHIFTLRRRSAQGNGTHSLWAPLNIAIAQTTNQGQQPAGTSKATSNRACSDGEVTQAGTEQGTV